MLNITSMFQRILYIFNIVVSRLELSFDDIESELLISVVVTVIYTTLSIKFVIALICATKNLPSSEYSRLR